MERRSVRIGGGIVPDESERFARSLFRESMGQLFDPERPTDDPNRLLAEAGGRLRDPATMNHHCPVCERDMSWDLFKAHVLPCYRKWRSVALDITRRRFAGASIEQPRERTLHV